MKKILSLLIIASSLILTAANNLLLNPEFQMDTANQIFHWKYLEKDPHSVVVLSDEGPEKQAAVRLDLDGFHFSQPGIKLVPGEPYRLGVYIRTKNFITGNDYPNPSRIIVHNDRWEKEYGIFNLPENTNGWKKYEVQFIAPKSRNGRYTFCVWANRPKGELYVSAPYLIPVSEKAIRLSKSSDEQPFGIKRIIPVYPKLTAVSSVKPEMEFYYAEVLPRTIDNYRVEVRTKMQNSPQWSQTAYAKLPAGRRFRITLPGVKAGKGILKIEVKEKQSGKIAAVNEYPFQAIQPLPPVQVRHLNSLVGELKKQVLKNGAIEFTNPREGWIYIKFGTCNKEAKGFLDNESVPVLKYREGEQTETMRYLSAGNHTLKIENAVTGSLQIRTIPEILLYPLQICRKINRQEGYYDAVFHRRYLWPVINFYASFPLPRDSWQQKIDAELRDRGCKFSSNLKFSKQEWMSAEKMVKKMHASPALAASGGAMVDEVLPSYSPETITAFADACWTLTDYDKNIYTYFGDGIKSGLNMPRLHSNFFAAVTNVSQGRGKLVLEAYLSTRKTQAEFDAYMQFIPYQLDTVHRLAPDAAGRILMVMSCLTACGSWNIHIYPQVDVKYVFDRFFHDLAVSPECTGLYGVGIYSIQHSDEEIIRWVAACVRHYCIEGKRDLLSDRYGFTLIPGHLQNGDFENNGANWNIRAAEPGSAVVRTIPLFGNQVQGRRSNGRQGDTVLLMRQSTMGTNSASQKAVKLTPGKLYSLQFVTLDQEYYLNPKRKYSGEKPEIQAYISRDDAEIIDSYSHLERTALCLQRPIFTHTIILRARKAEVNITISDTPVSGKNIPRTQMVNFVHFRPYFSSAMQLKND